MAGFKASDIADDLDYDFTPYGSAGRMAEPSYEQINAFRKVLAAMVTGIGEELRAAVEGDTGKLDTAAVLKQASAFLERDDSAERDMLITAMADVSSLPRDEIAGLPYRVQQTLMGYLVGIFLQKPASLGITN